MTGTPLPPRISGRWRIVGAAWYAVFALALVIVVASLPGYARRVMNSPQAIDAPPAFVLVASAAGALASIGTAALCLTLAAVLYARRRDEAMAVFTSFLLLGYATALAGPIETLDWIDPRLADIGLRLQAAAMLTPAMLLLYLFPNGRFVPRWTRWAALASLPFITLAFVSTPSDWYDLRSPFFTLVNIVLPALILTGVFAQVYRYRRVSDVVERQQTKWFVLGLVIAMLGFIVVTIPYVILQNLPPGALQPWWTPLSSLGWWLALMILPLSLAVAIMRYRLWDVDVLINRALVYGALTAAVVIVYVLIVGALGALFQSIGNLAVSLVATGIAAILFQPLRARLQRGVNRLMYGERDDPYAVLSRLGDRLKAIIAPDAVLPAIVETVAHALRLPYAAIELTAAGDGPRSAAIYPASTAGGPPSGVIRLPLVYQGDQIGVMALAPRAPNEPFTPAEQRLLEDVADQAGVAVHNVRLTADLQHSRERLVTAREEERRRLRRDLHDGLGPALASLTLKLDAARNQLKRDPDTADRLLGELKAQTQTAIADIRRLVYDLRPPALDELGLVSAIREQAARYSTNGLSVTVEAPEAFPPLPAAVEVAAYRIASEALTNVVNHAGARHCAVRFSIDDALAMEIVDDGMGLPADARSGVGLTSMHERAAELGGTWVIERVPTGGTRVMAKLPING